MVKKSESKIEVGSFVRLRKGDDRDLIVDNLLKDWAKVYGRGPFKVRAMSDDCHVSLEDENGKMIFFGNTADPSLHIGFVRPW